MNSLENNKNICRICLDHNVVLDWNDAIFVDRSTTYKDCYYKYTQLDYLVADTFSTMLCHNCSNGLQNVHTLISKALESHELFQNKYIVFQTVDLSATTADDIICTPTEFETVLATNVEVADVIQYPFDCDNPEEEFIEKPTQKLKNYANAAIEKSIKIKELCNESDKLAGLNKNEEQDRNTLIEDAPLDNKLEEKKDFDWNTPRMCSICGKVLKNKYKLQRHEKTHVENRERKETCTVCGLKLYCKTSLYCHMLIHKENREKRHKCEFCDKEFYNRGGLNIHRRIHLGQMIPCNFCPKQFCREVDLQRHIMRSHSATTINSDIKEKSRRCFVRCEHCDKSILSTSYKSHTAAHLNEPLMKCSICSKEYFRRDSCVNHLKKVHQKTNAEYKDFIIIYTKKRLSHLFLKQNAEIQYIKESPNDE